MRLTRGVFLDVAYWMVGFGLLIGSLFPFFVIALGVPASTALTPIFFAASLGAGALAGLVNQAIARKVVGHRLEVLADSMAGVEQDLKAMIVSGDLARRSPGSVQLPVDSEDEIGKAAHAFNRLVESLTVATTAQATIREFSEMLTSELEPEDLARGALQRMLDAVGATGGLIRFEALGEPAVAVSIGLRDAESVATSTWVAAAVRTGRQQVIVPTDGDDVVIDPGFRQVLICPVVCKDLPSGFVVLATGRNFDEDGENLVEVLVRGLGLGLSNAGARDSLKRMAALDSLTGVYNRRLGLDRLHEEFVQTVRNRASLGVLMFDVDHFKRINDEYGHVVGDRVLKAIADVARGSMREGDVLYRYGGDEFGGVLPAAIAEDVLIIGERLRRAVEDSDLVEGDGAVRVTVSVGGAACVAAEVKGEDALLRSADEALYRAKESGRNRTEISA